jgi:transposase
MRERSTYPNPFKDQVVQEFLQPGTLVSSVAISHCIKWQTSCVWVEVFEVYRCMFHPRLQLPANRY